MTKRRFVATAVMVCIGWTAMVAQQPMVHELGIKYMRDSEEYATLTRQVYRIAGEAVTRAASSAAGRRWAVVLDIDETTLDNSTYQLERAAYGVPYDDKTWDAWVERREAFDFPLLVNHERVRMSGVGVAQHPRFAVDDAIEHRDEHLGRRELVPQR